VFQWLSIVGLLLPAALPAQQGRGAQLSTRLSGFEEVPALVVDGRGSFRAKLNEAGDEIEWVLRYERLEGNVLQAHIHVGQPGVNGGISLFLCTNLGNGPLGTQECPPSPAEVSGTATAADIVGPAGQGVGPEQLSELLRALRAGTAYANVHSSLFPGGEIRGQIGHSDRH
jgi:hypothetical protein